MNSVRSLLVLTAICLTHWTIIGCDSGGETDNAKSSLQSPRSRVPLQLDRVDSAPLPHQQLVKASPRPPRPDDWFEQLAGENGVDFAYRDGSESGFYTLLESVGGGAALFDFDQDGDVDLFVTGGGQLVGTPIRVQGRPCAMFRNDGQGNFTDVTKETGLDASDLYTHGVTVGDFDRDGFPDLFVTGYGGCRLHRNVEGKHFVDVTQQSGLECPRWNTAAAWCDMDQDGWLDLYVVTYCDWTPDHTRRCIQRTENGRLRDVCAPSQFAGDKDFLWRNRGDGSFEDITDPCGITARHRGLGVIVADFDEDAQQDIYVANDVDENDMYYGSSSGEFQPYGVLAGVALSPHGDPEGSMGVDFGDVDGDGDADLFYANFIVQDNSLLRQVRPRAYVNVTDLYGLLHVSRRWVGFGAALVDLDNDGWLDLAVANGHVLYGAVNGPYYQPAQLFRNEDGSRYAEVSQVGGPYFSVPHAGRGLAVGDIDNNGSSDLVVVHQNEPVAVLRNRRSPGAWVRVELRGTKSNPNAVGAKVSARVGERTMVRWVRGGGGYLSYFDPRIIFPIGQHQSIDVQVRWPGGTTERFAQLEQGATHLLVEGQGQN